MMTNIHDRLDQLEKDLAHYVANSQAITDRLYRSMDALHIAVDGGKSHMAAPKPQRDDLEIARANLAKTLRNLHE